jgi:hypothetical protein
VVEVEDSLIITVNDQHLIDALKKIAGGRNNTTSRYQSCFWGNSCGLNIR